MAAVDLSTITGSLATLFEDSIAMQINRAVVLSQLLDIKSGTGKNIQWVARFGTATPAGAVIADGADVSVFNSDDKVPAVLQFGTYHDAFSISGKARAGAAAAGNPSELANLFAEEIMESATRLAKAIAVDCYTGDGSSDTLHGLRAAAGGVDSTGTYAGIDRAVRTQWAANETAVAGALSLDAMRTMRKDIYVASGEKPDLIICDPTQHENYAGLLSAERRYVDDVRLRGNTIRLDGGYQVLEFDGIPVVEDVNCPSGEMLFLNTSHVDMHLLPDGPNAGGAMGYMPLGGTPEEQFGPGSMKFSARIQPLATTGDAFKFQLICYPQIRVRRPNACGVLTGLSA